MTDAAAPLVFVPGLGFRPHDSLMLRTPVTHQVTDEGKEWSVSVDSVIADRDGTLVAVTLYGPFKMKGERHPQPEVEYQGFHPGAPSTWNGVVGARTHLPDEPLDQ